MKMINKNNLIDINKFIKQVAEKEFQSYFENKEIQKIKEILNKKNQQKGKSFTFTVGDINAYLG